MCGVRIPAPVLSVLENRNRCGGSWRLAGCRILWCVGEIGTLDDMGFSVLCE
ncbi:hypothetical protein VRK_20490 [Vibrio sp. MEBiC08052]|nr:hypothetical protein VRK_20490 [Vibrio sp. MEBiC08052]